MKKLFTLTCSFLLFGFTLTAQQWVQTGSTPEGGGITEITVVPETFDIFVSTDSYDWPDGAAGGIRRSTDGGETWENLIDAWVARTITYAADGNLYASVWPSPAKEGIYRSSDNGDTWEILDSTSSGNRYFAFAVDVNVTPHIIYAATWTGVKRSMDNGETWDWANEGILFGTQSNDIAIDSNGVVAVGTTTGLYISTDSGEQWVRTTGEDIENKEITKLKHDYLIDDGFAGAAFFSGTDDGRVYRSYGDDYQLPIGFGFFSDNRMSGHAINSLEAQNKRMHGTSNFSYQPIASGFHGSTNEGETWEQNNSGLPGNPAPTSALAGYVTASHSNFVIGLNEFAIGGAKVFTLSVPWENIVGVQENDLELISGLILEQNFPNPFGHSTLITYHLENAVQVNLNVYAADGQLVSLLVDSRQSRGEHKVNFNAESLTEGVYYYKLETEGSSEVRKMVVLK